MTIISSLDVKAYSRITYAQLDFTNDSDYESFIDADIIPVAEKNVEDHCGVPDGYFEAGGATVTDIYLDSDGTGYFWVTCWPIVSMTSLAYNSKGLSETANWVTLLPGPGSDKHYIVYKDRGLIYVYNLVPPVGLQNVKATYKTGYAATPDTVIQVVRELCADMLRDILKRKINPQEISQLVLEGRVPSAESRPVLTDEMKKMLTPYRLSRVVAA